MDPKNSLDEFEVIAALLHDVYYTLGDAISIAQLGPTLRKVRSRYAAEGLSFLTKSLPKLGKAFDKALSGYAPLNAISLRFKPQRNSKLPKLFGELFNRVLQPDGTLLPQPDVCSVGAIRQLCYLFYKYKLPYAEETENEVIAAFLKTEDDLLTVQQRMNNIRTALDALLPTRRWKRIDASSDLVDIARKARVLLSKLFSSFDPHDIYPCHGPGAVATRQQLWEKFHWSNVSANITRTYPLDEYFYSSLGHICDSVDSIQTLPSEDLPARVILVPKDSRGPRLISCEPVDYQWVQQGLSKAIVNLVERHPLTKWNVSFTDQKPNQFGALLGSKTGKYVTLDLKEASDRISFGLVRLLFPSHVFTCLASCRSSSTVLPNGDIQPLLKFAPMGSSLCFPVLALSVWAILTAVAPDGDTRERIRVYGDDVIVPTAFAEDAMISLESFGLVINRDKSCTSGLFRESCGVDAFNGVNVTPVRFRTVWSSTPSPEVYTSYIAYANALRRKQYYTTYERVAGELHRIYGAIPATDMLLACPSLDEVPDEMRPKRFRINHEFQRKEWLVRNVRSPVINKRINGWEMLLRYFTELSPTSARPDNSSSRCQLYKRQRKLSVCEYTRRDSAQFTRTWCAAEMQQTST